MNASIENPARKHTGAWLIALLIAFILGFLLAWWLLRQPSLAKPVCPQASQPATTSAAQTAQPGGGGKPGAPGKGSPAEVNGGGHGNNEVIGNGAPASGGGGTPAGGNGSGSGKVSGGGSFDVSGKTIVNGAAGAAGDGNAPGDTPSASGGGNGDLKLPPANGSAGGDLVVNTASGNGRGKAPGDGKMDGGGGAGETPQGDVQSQPSSAGSSPHAIAGDQPVAAGSGGALKLGPPMDDSDLGASKPANKVVAALDYRYDKSGLPHYPNALKVASGTDAAQAAAAAGPNSKNFSVTEILTDDSPDIAAAWYHAHLPAGWNELSMPSAAAMDQAIAQTKAPAANSDPVGAMLNALVVGPQLQQSKPGIDAARAAGLTIFQPADPNTDHRMIIVIRDSKTGKTGVLLMKKADTQ